MEMQLKIKPLVIPLLYVYAKKQKSDPVDDELTLGLEKIFSRHHNKDWRGSYYNGWFDSLSATMGVHTCTCGERSENVDYLISTWSSLEDETKLSKKDLQKYFIEHGIDTDTQCWKKVTRTELLENCNLKYSTNTLCIHYLRYHRDEVPDEELAKVRYILDMYD
jgi:hypothetical protein